MKNLIANYLETLRKATGEMDWSPVEVLAKALYEAVQQGRCVYLCGNGGSAGNAVHLANDFLYGIAPDGRAMKVEALTANTSVLTCLGNDIGYDNIFAHQLQVKAEAGDILIVLSGSGNSTNIIRALEAAKQKNMQSFAILGFGGGKAKALADVAIHFAVDDMQIAEDTQLIVGHMLMQHLNQELKRV
ncbi:SIS domain-containing protein [Planctobacterium marinum]|uniref:SIS domain-containing protein n=1 Tax=Planctobacterium marinum TaxID=1631968 RepID=UPI001E4F0054|nr:SIS domain-containing protein [Planctobacterium marinum]MCC2606249.1 SIS domain-containing protein [Planctobacterium marinum]